MTPDPNPRTIFHIKNLQSASRLSPDAGEPAGEGGTKRLYRFDMSRRIPAYLVALAVGDLVSAEIGPRSRVWAEPAVLEAAKAEFEGVTEKFLAVGEELYGPYVWGTYDILVMPPGAYVKYLHSMHMHEGASVLRFTF